MHRRCSLAVIGCLIALTGCGDDGPDAATRPTPSTSQPTIDTDTVAAATVSVQAEGCSPRTRFGVGTAIDDGLIVTVAHVIAGSEEVDVAGIAGRSTADVVFFDPDLDIALLRPARPLGPNTALRSSGVEAGERGLVVLPRLSSPAPDDGSDDVDDAGLLDVTIARPVTIRTTDIYRETDVERAGFEVTATIEPGDSGAMVHTTDGGAGLIWARSNERIDRAWAVDLPPVLFDGQALSNLTEPVDVGRCVD